MDWDARFRQQAGWTAELRAYLFDSAGVDQATRVLEVGCGTGAVLRDLETPANLFGVDINSEYLRAIGKELPGVNFTRADAHELPWQSGSFDITFCHFLLLWVNDPLNVLLEMKRVTRHNGCVLALAEPDYENRVDLPAPLSQIGHWQTDALRQQGADPGIGKKLSDLFYKAGLVITEAGALKENNSAYYKDEHERELEWKVITFDTSAFVPYREIERMKKLDAHAWHTGQRRLFVPTYYASGLV